jgi:RHH-type proline utilization regulon transcriptional repressor/proline dehydrogenase/delta 1-pyrroline-5-carboxylate dehydrogenase
MRARSRWLGWLVEPHELEPGLWTPGVRENVQPGSWFHRTECFGPVLGLVRARDLDEAIDIQNGTDFGLTGGIHSLDEREVDVWLDRVEVGNAYVNRVTTGAIVQRQPFGGWKRSTIGPGAKAGGPNYVAQLGTWRPPDGEVEDERWLSRATAGDEAWWAEEFGREHDPTGLRSESNRFRYRPVGRVVIVVAAGREVAGRRVVAAARRCGCDVTVVNDGEESVEHVVGRVRQVRPDRIRVVGECPPELHQVADELGIHLADDPVTSSGRIELLPYLREQAISRTMHRYGNLL